MNKYSEEVKGPILIGSLIAKVEPNLAPLSLKLSFCLFIPLYTTLSIITKKMMGNAIPSRRCLYEDTFFGSMKLSDKKTQ
jgi:hypothetical protein